MTEPLTPREIEVTQLVAQGLSNQEIADRLIISERTVRTHVSIAFQKAQCHNRVQLTLWAQREGVVGLYTPAQIEAWRMIRSLRRLVDQYEQEIQEAT